MGTPQFFEIPSTGTYRLTDGTAAYQFTEGDMIPMSLAIALGIDGAAYDAVPVFDAAQVAAIEALIAESGGGGGGGGGGATFPMVEGVWYDNRTAIAGLVVPVDGNSGVNMDEIAGALISITTTDAAITSVSFPQGAAPEDDATLRAAIYAASQPLAGAKIGDIGTVIIPASWYEEPIEIACNIPVDPGLYWVVMSVNVETGLLPASFHGGDMDSISGSAPFGAHESGGQAYVGFQSVAEGAQSALPADLTSTVSGDDLTRWSPFVRFQITHD